MNSTIVSIFWTGGYDSTFRICQLSRKNVIIQPYYLSDNRKSEEYELTAIKTISEKLRNNPETKAKIEPLTYIPIEMRHSNEEISSAYSALRKKDFMGSQYEWLGVFALEHPGIEMSIHKDDKAIELIQKHGKLKKVKGEYGEYYVIDNTVSSPDLITVFQNLRFPLADYTKLEMKNEYHEMGLADIIDDTWFCFNPIDGKPCGKCNPCRYTIEEGMIDRFSKKVIMRYKISSSLPWKAVRQGKEFVRKIVK